MRAVEDTAVDIWAAQDTGVGDGGAPGQAALWSAGKLNDEMGFSWGVKMGWTHQQGHKGKQGIRRGGTFLAVQERWRVEMHKVETDSRGCGRYVMREMLGKSGDSMVVVSLYLPTRPDHCPGMRSALGTDLEPVLYLYLPTTITDVIPAL